jgi:hypothetical protein
MTRDGTSPAQRRAYEISGKIMSAEVQAQRMLGAEWSDAYKRAWAIGEEAYNLVLDPYDKPAVHLEPRTITGRARCR